ncbi:membrane-bound lytic murein transglycosylase MltC [Thalassotalea sp. G20_0]|uniref:membrane-bound lytic murein transglycosylase MltC n=1 Tax=Thalassotalea sp. G20_0 TaxID=2821093 RepID=UPI001ADBDD80|nr:membrane-bound lytic murein transglycosylase MltC [Thalassotalea sp. G20_0]MBO9495745.1 membrane-bound lytic murein transglycosylase MltC [Thalassotalea sp. G20_0]
MDAIMPRLRTLILLTALSSPLITGCSSGQANSHGANYVTNAALKELGPAGNAIAIGMDREKDVIAFEALVRILIKEARVAWGDEKKASSKEYVKYTNHYRTRVFVDFDSGKVHVETLDRTDLRKAIAAILLTPYAPDQVDLFSDRDVPVGEQPMLYGQVLDHEKQPIRWQWRALRYADYLIQNQLTTRRSPKGRIYAVDFELVEDHLSQRQYQYASLVRKYARIYDVEESLIYAVIRTESSFNPYAVSSSNAYGLMQIIPKTAGRDVFDKVKKLPGQPSKNWLFQPHNNIDTGTAYLSLLENHYLKQIRDPLSRKYTIISAYNGGDGNVFATFDRNSRDRAIQKINDLKPNQVYWALTQKHPRGESRRYLEKVSTAQKDFYQGNI